MENQPLNVPRPGRFDDRRPEHSVIIAQARTALAEDLGSGDLTASLLPESQRAHARLVTRERAVLCGCAWFEAVFRQLDPSVQIEWHAGDGDIIVPDQELCTLEGPSRALLSGERTAMNYLQTLSGTATRTRRYAEAVAGLTVEILDTRKTLPGLRVQQKYAVLCGGGHNHRMGLYDAILIKENHIMAAGSLQRALDAARSLDRQVEISIEVESIAELEQALEAGAEAVLLDNFPVEELTRAVKVNAGRARLEASGGITLETVRAVAETGVDRISIGDLTKDLTAVDLSMRFTTL